MKLLLDHNLSHRLLGQLTADFPGSAHVRDYAKSMAADPIVWNHAATHGFTIISKGADFQERALLLGPPPKVIWTTCWQLPDF